MSTNDPAGLGALESRYANYFEIGFNQHEVIIQCGQFYSGDSKALIHTRVVTTPTCATSLLELLRKTLQEHTFEYGNPTRD